MKWHKSLLCEYLSLTATKSWLIEVEISLSPITVSHSRFYLTTHIQPDVVLTSCGVSVVMFFRFVTAGEIRTRAEFFEPFITGLSNATVDQVCKYTYHPFGFKPLW